MVLTHWSLVNFYVLGIFAVYGNLCAKFHGPSSSSFWRVRWRTHRHTDTHTYRFYKIDIRPSVSLNISIFQCICLPATLAHLTPIPNPPHIHFLQVHSVHPLLFFLPIYLSVCSSLVWPYIIAGLIYCGIVSPYSFKCFCQHWQS